jgi:hypothetical protein
MTDYVMRHGRRIEIEPADIGEAPRRRPRGFSMQWVKLPRHWITALEQTNISDTHKLAHRILWAAFEDKRGDGVVTLSQAVVPGMSATGRKRATRKLIELGLIVPLSGWGERKTPRVKIVYYQNATKPHRA